MAWLRPIARTNYFEMDCEICGHTLRLCYESDSETPPCDPQIVDAGNCTCLLGQDWIEDALDAHLEGQHRAWEGRYDSHPEI